MNSQSASDPDQMMHEQLKVIYSSRTTPDAVASLLEVTAFEDVMRAAIERADTGASRLVLVAGRSQDANTLGRVVSHPKTPLETIRSIRDLAHGSLNDGEPWDFLYEYACRVIRRRETGRFEFQEEP